MEVFLDPLGYPFFARALGAAALVGIVCAVVGTYVVLKGLAFIGDAISHAAFPGIVAAFMVGGSFYVGAGVAAVGTALAINWVSRRGGLRMDTTIGVLFAGTFALGVLMYASIRGYVGDLFHLLFGNVLGISDMDLLGLAILAGVVLLVVAALWKELLYSTFDPLAAQASGLPVARLEYVFIALVALAIVVSLQAVGIVLVVAMLVTPAAAAQLLTSRFGQMMAVAVGIGAGSAVAGLYLSFWFELASGASIVLVETLIFLVALLLGPRTGLAARARRRSAVPSSVA